MSSILNGFLPLFLCSEENILYLQQLGIKMIKTKRGCILVRAIKINSEDKRRKRKPEHLIA
jgi:hypothetical protein